MGIDENNVNRSELAGYCSWCNNYTTHLWQEKRRLFRKVYICNNCMNETLPCRVSGCKHFTKAGLAHQKDINLGFLKKTWERVDNFYCSEHRHEVLSFEKGDYQVKYLNEIDYTKFEYEARNYQKRTSAVVGIVGGTLVMGPIYYFGAPAIASWLGTKGFLGAASTGTQISTLSGAALTKASLAKVGFGALSVNGLGMAGGTFIIGGFGGALGGVTGATSAGSFYKTIEDFEYIKLTGNGKKEVVFVNGLFSQTDKLFTGWIHGIKDFYDDASFTGLRWESKALAKLGGLELSDLSNVLKKIPKKLGAVMTRLTKFKKLTGILGFLGLINNLWFVTYYRAAVTGYILADNIARLHKGTKIDLYGHSLGARVIFYALQALSTKDKVFVENVYLFGGAQERKDNAGWTNASKSVSGKIYNVYSSNDNILKIFYRAGTLGSSPIGLKPIKSETDKIVNLDASEWINGHSDYHENFKIILNEIGKIEEKNSWIHSTNSTTTARNIAIILFFIVLITVFTLLFI